MSMSQSERAQFEAMKAEIAELKQFVRVVGERPHLFDALREKIDALDEPKPEDGPPEEPKKPSKKKKTA